MQEAFDSLVVPNGIFIYWLCTEFHSPADFINDRLALGFILDCVLAVALIAWYLAKHPIGKIKWYWFVVLSLIGGLSFRQTLIEYQQGPLADYLPCTAKTREILASLAALKPRTLATMHGSTFSGDGEKAILELAGVLRNCMDDVSERI